MLSGNDWNDSPFKNCNCIHVTLLGTGEMLKKKKDLPPIDCTTFQLQNLVRLEIEFDVLKHNFIQYTWLWFHINSFLSQVWFTSYLPFWL